jgi:hypothetical protein
MKNLIMLILFFLIFLYSQIIGQTAHRFFVNKINLPIDNKGLLASVNIPDPDPFINGAGGKFDESVFLFRSGFFLSGYANGEFFSNTVSEGSIDYQPGIINSNPEDTLNIIYVVRKDDIPFSSSWQNWKEAVLLGADFYDGNDDGIYDPTDRNYNGTWDTNEDMPPLIGDEIAWCVYNDGVPANQRLYNVSPIGINIQQSLFAKNNPDLENIIFIKYKIENTGLVADVLDSVFFSPWDDTDIGEAIDDLSGCDTTLSSIFTYNFNDDSQYGVNPPAIYTTIIQGPLINTSSINDTATIKNGTLIGEHKIPGYKNAGLFSFAGYGKNAPGQSFPSSLQYVHNYILGLDGYGNPLNPCDTLWGKVYGNVNCTSVNPIYWFSGDPVERIGWLDKIPADDRKIATISPFTLEKSKPVEIILALVVGRGSDELNSITVARDNVQKAISEYQNNFSSMTYTPPAATNPVKDYIIYQNYPNPFNPSTTIRYEIPQDGIVTIEVFDILGQKIQTLLNEFKKADRYEIEFNGGNLSSGVYLYSIRVNDFIQIKKMILLK